MTFCIDIIMMEKHKRFIRKKFKESMLKDNKKQGIAVVASALAIQLVLGVAYIWTMFQIGVRDSIFHYPSGPFRNFETASALAALTFSLLLAFLSIGSVLAGKLVKKFSIRTVVISGGIISAVGFFLSFFATHSFVLIWVGYGILGGFGMGFTYATTIACAQHWYPHKKGFVTGLIVAALGLGGVVFTPIIHFWWIPALGGVGVAEPRIFLILAGIFLVVCTVGGLFLKEPSEEYTQEKLALAQPKKAKIEALVEYDTKRMLRSPRFWLAAVTFILAVMGGLMMIAFAVPIARELRGLEIYFVGGLVVSAANSGGRLAWGAVSDKLGRLNTLLILLGATAILPLFVTIVPSWGIFIIIGFIGFFYGGILSLYPSLTADLFGTKNLAMNYGVMLLAFGVGAIVSSQIGGIFMGRATAAGDQSLILPAIIIASASAVAGIIMMCILKFLNKRKRARLLAQINAAESEETAEEDAAEKTSVEKIENEEA